ncbi:MAG: hypothetical protein JWM68_1365 [Verrucomicrobiales bacterium]|nr:hypothetical protein [Verrucomicrobiales bacterium]
MNTAVVTFDSSGKGSCLFTELIDLHSIGSLEITRATTIEFNNTTQLWEVRQNGAVMFQNHSRAICLTWEHQEFNR